MKNLERVNLPILDQAFKANPYPVYDALRQPDRSIVPVRLPTGVQAWLVTSYAAARELLADPRLSKVAGGAENASHSLFHHLLTIDPPDHARLRSMIAREFSSRRVEQLRPRVRDIAGHLLDEIAPQGEVDLIEAFALPLPLKVICEFVGVPASDEPLIRRWSALLFKADFDDPDQIPVIAQDLDNYLLTLTEKKRDKHDNSLFCSLVANHDKGEISEKELTAMGFLLLFAGHETTVNLIGNGVLALLSNPCEWSKLCATGERARVAVDELLRFDSPLEVATPRFATSEISIENVRIQPGEMVFIGLAAANRDPRRFEDSGRLNLERNQSEVHIAFGHGIHYCIGAALARLEGEVGFGELARRFPDLQLSVPVSELKWKPGLGMRGLINLPVRFEVQKRALF